MFASGGPSCPAAPAVEHCRMKDVPVVPLSPLSKGSNASSGGQVLLWARDASTASLDQDPELYCDEARLGASAAPAHAQHSAAPRADSAPASTSGRAWDSSQLGWRFAAPDELAAMIGTHLARERELVPQADYLGARTQHPLQQQQQHAGERFVTPQMRSIVASWLSEVASEFRMQQETLFLAVALLDRFQALSPAGVPRNVLQLVAVACMMVASKQDEVSHPTIEDFTEIAADAFRREDLLRMERLLLDQLDWRVALPTAYGFLHLLTQAFAGRLAPRAIALAAYLCELSLLDYGTLAHPPSAVAAAALAVGAAWHGGGAAGRVGAADVERLTGYTAADLGAPAAQLLHLHRCAAAADATPAYQPLAFVRDKYAQEAWVGISRCEQSDEALAAVAAGLAAAPAGPQLGQQQQQQAAWQRGAPTAHAQQPVPGGQQQQQHLALQAVA
ncbi:G2 mitotic-specific cyclin-A [Raphidocelis subcapitata]|uniref:G2 mitotic-specific cyclin-A n=1 Tax=Raphidocelis subcapitata TaxID=307507 RepID=A0A2V0P5I6_9CHLO|nr:G2 mitotic-specific cyclin-A [Raphidocelis subcapitata]|eukprot:GBF92345.1 G2 mitotic-specific cyclin-A [Raphidocelis subcapitata]